MKSSHFSLFTLLLLAISFTAFTTSTNSPSNQQVITGTIFDESQNPLIGATITEIGSSNVATSDYNGYYSITVHDPNAKLKFTYVGMQSKTIDLKTKNLTIPLIVSLTQIVTEDEIVIAEGKSKKERYPQPAADQAISYESVTNAGMSRSKTRLHPVPPPSVMHYNEDRELEAGNYSEINENEFFNSAKIPLSTLSIDVDRASYSNIRRFLQQGQMPPSDAVRIEEMVNYFDYNYDAPSMNSTRPFNTVTNLTTCPWNTDHKLLHVALQGAKMDRNEIPSSNFVFLIDVSGSMNNANKLPLLKSAFKLFLNQLDEKDRVAIVVYAGAAGCALESTPGSDKNKIFAALDNLRAGGSTAGAAGIQQAYKIAEQNFIKGGNNRVILATDGDFNVGTSGDDALVKLIEEKRESGVFLSVLGFGQGNYMDGKMQKIADAGNGNHSYINDMQEAKKVLMDEFGGTMFTIAKDVKIQIEFNPAAVESYRMVGYENRVLQAEDFNDDSKDAGEMGAGHMVTILYEIIPVGGNSSFSKKIDPLKYQENRPEKVFGPSSELATIKYRFKKPDGKTSTKSEEIIKNKTTDLDGTSANVQWAATVAEFGLLLRKSKYAIHGNYDQVIASAKNLTANNGDKYRTEFVDLVEIAKALDTQFLTVEKE